MALHGPDVTVVVPACGRPHTLDRCLAGLEAQRLDHGAMEVVVVDDGSPETLEPVVATHKGSLTCRFLRHEPNRGRAAARNCGARAAQGALLLFLDSDMMASPGLVAAHLEAHAAHEGEKAGSREARVVLGPIPQEPTCRGLVGRYMERRGHMKRGVSPENVPFRYYVSSNTSLARELFERTGGYDEGFIFYGGEDIDMGYRLHKAGARLVVAPGAVAYHLYRYDLATTCRRMYEFGKCTLPLVFERHPELQPVFHLDLVDGRGPLTTGLFRAITAGPFLAIGRVIAPLIGIVHPWVLSYLLVGHYFRGYADTLSARQRKAGPAGRPRKGAPAARPRKGGE